MKSKSDQPYGGSQGMRLQPGTGARTKVSGSTIAQILDLFCCPPVTELRQAGRSAAPGKEVKNLRYVV